MSGASNNGNRRNHTSSVTPRIGWIGLGAMGAPMATSLAAAGFEVVAYDVDPVRMEVTSGARIATAVSPAQAAAACDVLALMVATPQQANDALFASEGAATGLRRGAVVLIMATIGPDAICRIERQLAGAEVAVVDAPVSGGAARAASGDLLVMIAGAAEPISLVQPLLDVMAAHVAKVGDHVGDGQRVKLVNQLLCGVHIAAAAEALAFAEAIGLDARACWETVRHGAAASFMLDDRGARMLAEGQVEVRSALQIFVKDMGMVVAAARDRQFPSPMAAAAEQLYLAGAEAGLGGNDDSALIEVLRSRQTQA
jgi:3-hydroxyisobutyrate dehydrogenase